MKLKDLKKELLKDPKFRKAYETPDIAWEIAIALIKARIEAKMTQEALAKLMGTKQEAISRAESGEHMPSSTFLYKFGKALKRKLVIKYD